MPEITVTQQQFNATVEKVAKGFMREHGKDLSDYHRAAFGPGHPTGFKVGSNSAKPARPVHGARY